MDKMDKMDIHLQFEPHIVEGATRAVITFANGYGASIITGPMFYTSINKPYELAIFKNGKLCHSTYLTKDVLGYLTAKEVSKYLRLIEMLPLRPLWAMLVRAGRVVE